MPTYLYRCSRCKTTISLVKKIAERNERPWHCTLPMKLVIMPAMVAPTFAPYKAVAGDRRRINSKNEHRDFLKEFGLIEVGNDPSCAPPPDNAEQDNARLKESSEALKQLESIPDNIGELT